MQDRSAPATDSTWQHIGYGLTSLYRRQRADLQRSEAAHPCQQCVSLFFPACPMSGSNGGDEEKRPRQVRRRGPVRALQAQGPSVYTSNNDFERLSCVLQRVKQHRGQQHLAQQMDPRPKQSSEVISNRSGSPTPHPSPRDHNGRRLSLPPDVDVFMLSLTETYEDDNAAARMDGAARLAPDSIRIPHNHQVMCNADDASAKRFQNYFTDSVTPTFTLGDQYDAYAVGDEIIDIDMEARTLASELPS
ncbi:hypothetical protein ACCO45_009873 [Purpureocillium lilacinum]|uniref:Uncharacterized protein n=1 Tax=Purpureocillium lilacinum TaxID=33203 RepID=A0ACC4DJ19_PURLI